MARRKLDARQRLDHMIDASQGLDGCWPWRGYKTLGYGTIVLSNAGVKRKEYAHRFVHETIKGPIPTGAQVAHRCHNRICVNPAHLEAVPQQVNIQQTVDARNHAGAAMCGARNPGAKLTRQEADAIQKLLGTFTKARIARMFNISESAVRRIAQGKAWQKGDARGVWKAK